MSKGPLFPDEVHAGQMADAIGAQEFGLQPVAMRERMWVQFHMQEELDAKASYGWTEVVEEMDDDTGEIKFKRVRHKGAGRQIWREVEYITMMTPGDKTNVVIRPVRKDKAVDDTKRFPAQWAAFKAGVDQNAVSGTLLARWPALNRAQVKEYNSEKIYTVEQLAGMTDDVCHRFGPGAISMREKAKDFLKLSEGLAPLEEARAEVEDLRTQLKELRELVAKKSEEDRKRKDK